MTDEKSDGDDLFEDLDKFFAPIKDVEWDEPVDTSAKQIPQEEHVTVRAGDLPGRPSEGAEDVASTTGSVSETPETSSARDETDDDAWYDTSVMETLDDDGSPDPVPQANLFAEAQADDEPVFGESSTPSEEEVASDEEEDDETAATVLDEASADDEPSDDELEEAADHFADAIRDEARVSPFGDDELDDVATEPAGSVGSDPFADDASDRDDDDALVRSEGWEPRSVTVGTEGLGGPSWQEPASIEVGADIDRRGLDSGERDVPAAFLTGIVLAGVALGALLIGRGVFAFVATLMVLWAQGELYGVMAKHRLQPATAVGLVSGALIMAAAYLHGEAAMLAMFAAGVVATFLWFMAVPQSHRRNTLSNIGLTLLNVAWIPLLGGYLLVTLTMTDAGRNQIGGGLVVTVIGLTFLFDTAAFLVGSVWGGSFFHRPLAQHTSPKKSVEGVIGATVLTAIVGAALVPSFVNSFENKHIDALLLALVISVAATFGDLAESLVKRDMEIKDMGAVLPGHGGVLDRIDSLLFVAPATFMLFRIVLG
ncbi:MAG: phosphatidate cytidylyltransferase [Actinomycetota bacterium]|nr:phosphatidate cytidylyltransferase [Actinomycetota bacterium]